MLVLVVVMSWATTGWRWHQTIFGTAVRRVLVVGDADFSFSNGLQRALATSGRQVELLASGYEQEAGLCEKFPRARKHLEQLRAGGAQVLHGVDATRLSERFEAGSLSRVIWNFPHVVGKSNLRANRELLRAFLEATTPMLEQGADVCVALCEGQGGTALERVPTDFSQTWQATAQANAAGHVLVDAVPWAEVAVHGYAPCRAKGFAERAFALEFEIGTGGLLHVFAPEAAARVAGRAACNPFYKHEIHIARGSDSDVQIAPRELLLAVAPAASADVLRSVCHRETYTHPSLGGGTVCDCFEFVYQAECHVLTRDAVDALWVEVEAVLDAALAARGDGARLAKRKFAGVRASRPLGFADVFRGGDKRNDPAVRADREPKVLCDFDEAVRATPGYTQPDADHPGGFPRCALPLWEGVVVPSAPAVAAEHVSTAAAGC
jgi:hypothetical protein